MDDHQVYLWKLTGFAKMLRMNGIQATNRETEDVCRALLQVGFADRETVKKVMSAIYAKSREEQLIFNRVFDGFFISEEAMKAQAAQQAQQEAEMEAARQEAREELQFNGQPLLNEDQQSAYASMPREERQRLMDFLDRYKTSAERSPELYGNFIHSVFAKALLEQQMRMEDSAEHAAAADPELGLMFRDISEFRDEEIPKAITIIQDAARKINAELTARSRSSGYSNHPDFRKTIRKGLETGGVLYRLKYKKKPRRRRRMVLLCDVSGSMIQFSEFALRFMQSLNQAAESSRTFLFSEQMVEADIFSLQNMNLFRDYVARSGIYGKGTNLANALEDLCSRRPAVLNDATMLVILSDAKTIEQGRAMAALIKAKQLSGKIIWLNPIPENKWQYLRSTELMRSICPMVSCNTLHALAEACRKLTR